ncbi:hypothetical protein D3C84_1016850 [compost metagenome]
MGTEPIGPIKNVAGPASPRRRNANRHPRRERRRTMVHYAVAVCITFALMSTGILKGAYAQPPSPTAVEATAASTNHPSETGKASSYVERLMSRTVGLLDQWTDRAAGSKQNQIREEK